MTYVYIQVIRDIRGSADLTEGRGADPWHDALGEIRDRGARDVLGVQGACLEVDRVGEVRDGPLHSAAQLQPPAVPSADEPSFLHTSAAPCGMPVARSGAAVSGAQAKDRQKDQV